MNYKLTIIMSSYNQARFLRMAIDSVFAQKTNFPFNLIITDDCSTKDNSVEIIKEYANRHENITTLFSEKNGGYLQNILRAKSITKTPYFTLLDADDYWTDENYLQKAVDFLDKNQNFTIYNANVMCLKEDGETYPFIWKGVPASDFSLEDYLQEKAICTQTTGMVLRNVIFKHGIPDIMKNAVGTISERSFEGDFSRFRMHLKYGKAHYSAEISGVYRILSTGIWSSIGEFEKQVLEARVCVDYDEYFDEKYTSFFCNKAYREIKICNRLLDETAKQKGEISEKYQKIYFSVLNWCKKNADLIEDNPPKNYRYKMYLKLYNYLKRKLSKKGHI